MTDKQIIIKRIRDCNNCKFRPEISKVCSDYGNCYMVSEYIVNLREQLKAKEQECEKLKHKVELMMDCASCKIDEYKQTLIEIKKICKNNDELQGDFNVVDCDKYKLGKHNLANKIIQKISEYEVGNERN